VVVYAEQELIALAPTTFRVFVETLYLISNFGGFRIWRCYPPFENPLTTFASKGVIHCERLRLR